MIRAALAAFLVDSVGADERVPPAFGPCVPERGSGRSESPRVYVGQRITLDFKDADVVNVLRMLSEIGGESIVVTDDVRGRVTLRLVEVPWDQALDVVLQTNRLECVQVGNVLSVR